MFPPTPELLPQQDDVAASAFVAYYPEINDPLPFCLIQRDRINLVKAFKILGTPYSVRAYKTGDHLGFFWGGGRGELFSRLYPVHQTYPSNLFLGLTVKQYANLNLTFVRYLCVFFRERVSPLPNVIALGEAAAGPRRAANKRQIPRPRCSRARVRSLSCFAKTPSGTDRAQTIATLELQPPEGAPSRDYAQAADTTDSSRRSSQQEVAEATPLQASVGDEVLEPRSWWGKF